MLTKCFQFQSVKCLPVIDLWCLILSLLVVTSVEMVDVGIQSETEDLSDLETNVQGYAADRKPSFLHVVPEEEHEDSELVNTSLEMTCV